MLLPIMLAIALTASVPMAIPGSTPPTAMADARGEFTVDMARVSIPDEPSGGAGLILLGVLLFQST